MTTATQTGPATARRADAGHPRRYLILALLATLALLAAAASALVLLLHQDQQLQRQQQAVELTAPAAQLIQYQLQRSQTQLAVLTAHPALRGGPLTPEQLAPLAAQLTAGLVDSQVHLVSLQETRPRQELSFTARDLLQKARKGATAPVLMPGVPLRVLVAGPSNDGNALVLLEQDLTALVAQLQRLEWGGGGVTLSLRSDNRPLLGFGQRSGEPLYQLPLAGDFMLSYLAPATTPGLLSTPALWIMAVLALLLMLVLYLTLRAQAGGVQKDTAAVAHRLRTGQQPPRHRFRFKTLAALDQLLQDDLAERRRRRDSEPAITNSEPPRTAAMVELAPEVEELDAPTAAPPADSRITLDPRLFGRHSLRGPVQEQFTADAAEALGRAIGSAAIDAGQQRVVVARDVRASSPALSEALVRGLTASGRDVIDLGMVPLPVLYHAVQVLDTQTGVMVTGGHSAASVNGLKVILAGELLQAEALAALGQRWASGALSEGTGSVSRSDLQERYLRAVVDDVALARPLKVVVDPGNGAAAALAVALYSALHCEVIALNAEPDPQFPQHHPDPARPENLQALAEAVRAHGADLGLALDLDGDRLGVVSANGDIIWADRVLMLFARDLLSRTPGADILFDVRCSRELVKLVSRMGGRPMMCPTGPAGVIRRLRDTGARLGGEQSGHFYFADRWHGMDDALYAGARLLELLAQEHVGTDDVFARLRTGPATPELRIAVPDGSAAARVAALASQPNLFADATVSTVDGLRVDFEDGWVSLRASTTEAALGIRLEGRDNAALERISARFRTLLQQQDSTLTLPF